MGLALVCGTGEVADITLLDPVIIIIIVSLYWDLTLHHSPDSEVSRHAVPTVDMITAYKLDTLGPNLCTQFYLRKGHQNLEASKKFHLSFKKYSIAIV